MNRNNKIARLKSQLAQLDYPRLKMAVIVAITGGTGFLASVVLYHAGITAMAWRYPVAVGCAYLVFLALLGLWLRTSAKDYNGVDFPSGFTPNSNAHAHAHAYASAPAESVAADAGRVDASEGVGEAASALLDGELFIPVALILLLGALLLSSLWLVYSAPVLFAELLADAALSTSLYRHLKGIESAHWFATALRKTFWVFLLTAIVLAASGALLHHFYPEAHRLGDVL